jgi:hypothetical protein
MIFATLLLALAALGIGFGYSLWRNARGYNSDHFDLTNWKVTLPIAGEEGKALEVKQLTRYESPYFFDAPDGAMVFKAPVSGSTTVGSKYPRSELRERADGRDAAWSLKVGGTMTATLKIDSAPVAADGGPGRIVVGQIHGDDNELVRIYWDHDTVYFVNDRAIPDGKEHQFPLRDEAGLAPKVPLGQIFSYKIDAHKDALRVSVYVNGREYSSASKILPIWQTENKLYFKAGAYLGVNAAQGAHGTGQVSFYGLDLSHAPGGGLGGLDAAAPVK